MVWTHLVTVAWEGKLAHHPDRKFSAFMVDRIRGGFLIGRNYYLHTSSSPVRNMCRASKLQKSTDRYDQEKLLVGQLI